MVVQHEPKSFFTRHDRSNHSLFNCWGIKLQHKSRTGVFMSDKAFRDYFIRKLGGYSILKMAKFDESTNRYESDLLCDYTQGFLNGSLRTFQEQQKRIDELQLKASEDSRILHNIINIERNKCDVLQARIDEAIKHFNDVRNLGKDHSVYRALKALQGSEPKEQEPQACDHTMVEKTQFGDLQRTFECIFCDHKTTQEWVTTHE